MLRVVYQQNGSFRINRLESLLTEVGASIVFVEPSRLCRIHDGRNQLFDFLILFFDFYYHSTKLFKENYYS